jgi:hypothetical protein
LIIREHKNDPQDRYVAAVNSTVSLFQKGADLNDHDAMKTLGDMIKYGYVKPRNRKETAKALYDRATQLERNRATTGQRQAP